MGLEGLRRRQQPAAEAAEGSGRAAQGDGVARTAQVTDVARASSKKKRERSGSRVVV